MIMGSLSPGCVRGSVLREFESQNHLLLSVAKALQAYKSHASEGNQAEVLKRSCNLKEALDGMLTLASKLQGDMASWVQALHEAADRFDKCLDSCGPVCISELVNEKGATEAAKIFGKMRIPTSLPQLCGFGAVLSQHSFLSSLPTTTFEKTEDYQVLLKNCKTMVTIHSLKVETVKALFPDLVDPMNNAYKVVASNVLSLTKGAVKLAKEMMAVIDPYRTGNCQNVLGTVGQETSLYYLTCVSKLGSACL